MNSGWEGTIQSIPIIRRLITKESSPRRLRGAFLCSTHYISAGLLGQKPLRGAGYQHLLGGGQYLIIANAEAHLGGRLNDHSPL